MHTNNPGSLVLLILATLLFNMPVFSADAGVTTKAADYICIKAKEGGKTRLAIYPFTTIDGAASTDTEKYATMIMELHKIDKIARISPLSDPLKVDGIAELSARFARMTLSWKWKKTGVITYKSLVTGKGQFKGMY